MEEAIPKKPVPSNGSSNVRVNVVINLIRTLTLTILSFITFPYVCRILGDSTLGLYTWVNTFVYYFLILAKISIPNIAIRECVKVRDDKKAFSHKVQEFFLLQAFMTILSFGLMVSIMAAVPAFNDQTYMQLGFLLSINFLAGVFSFEWVYIALEKHFYIAVRSIATLALSAILTFVYVTRQGDYSDKDTQRVLFVYASITILSTILTSLINCLVLPKYVSFKKEGPYDFRSMLKPLIVLFFISFALTLYNETDVLLLGFLDSTKAAVGTYSVGVKGIDIIITIITSLYVFLIYETREYSLKAIFNLNNLKIVLFGGAIALITYFLAPYLLSYLPWKDAEIWKSYVLELVIMVAGDAIIYIGGLAIAREKLVSSFSAKHRKEMEEKNNG
jgi:O-antigen/teichoic acid export membrane protein